MSDIGMDLRLPDWVRADFLQAIQFVRDYGAGGAPPQHAIQDRRDDVPTQGSPMGLWEWLYTRWYQSSASPNSKTKINHTLPFSVIESLRAAHADTWQMEEGWRCESTGSPQWQPRGVGHILGQKGNDIRVLVPVDYVCIPRPGSLPRKNDSLLVTKRRDLVRRGFWTTYSEAWMDLPKAAALVRLYWNVSAEGATALVREWTSRVPSEPYMIKAPALSIAYNRADAVVIYLDATQFNATVRVIRDVLVTLQGFIGTATPRLAKPLAPGLAVAEDPAGDVSFGEHRCRMIAEALGDDVHDNDEAGILSIVNCFKSAGMNPGAPHLNPDSKQDYGL